MSSWHPQKPLVPDNLTIGGLIDMLDTIRDQRRELADRDKVLSKEYSVFEAQLLSRLEAEGVPKSSGMNATASVAETEWADMADYDTFMAYVEAEDADYLLQRRRISQPAIRDLLKADGEIPGITVAVKRSINLRKTSR